MHPKLFDILSHKEVPIDNKQLADYLSGNMTDADRHALEKKLMEGSEMEQDALEGLQEAGPDTNLLRHAEEINKNLHRQLYPTPARKRKKPITSLPLNWWLFGLLLVIILVAWGIIQLLS